jgi:K+-transporting ATPase ATPase B chain
VLGVIELKDIVKEGIKERFAELRQMGIKTVMITGDNPLTAASIAVEAGVDDFLAEATPEAKLALIREYQTGGRLVAMTGDGTNDAPALAQADVAVAMNSGTQAAKEAGNMVDLDSNPTKLIEIVNIGKTLLMTRGALTTFSVANDVAKYFAILPAAFASTYPDLKALDVMSLTSPASAIISGVHTLDSFTRVAARLKWSLWRYAVDFCWSSTDFFNATMFHPSFLSWMNCSNETLGSCRFSP